MAIHKLLFLSIFLLFLNISVLCDTDEEDVLFTRINSYRTSQNLTTLNKNENAECVADELADQFKNRPCTTEPQQQFTNFPQILAKCHLNVSYTKDGSIMPVCVPRLDSNLELVVTNFTKTQYSMSLNDSNFTGIGIGNEDDWIVVVLTTTNIPQGSSSTPTATNSTPTTAATNSTPTATTTPTTATHHDDDHDDDDSNGFTFTISFFNYFLVFIFPFVSSSFELSNHMLF